MLNINIYFPKAVTPGNCLLLARVVTAIYHTHLPVLACRMLCTLSTDMYLQMRKSSGICC